MRLGLVHLTNEVQGKVIHEGTEQTLRNARLRWYCTERKQRRFELVS